MTYRVMAIRHLALLSGILTGAKQNIPYGSGPPKDLGGSGQTLFSARYPVDLKEVTRAVALTWPESVDASEDPDPSLDCLTASPPDPVTDSDLAKFCQERYIPVLSLPFTDGSSNVVAADSVLTGTEITPNPTALQAAVFPNPVGQTLWITVPEELYEHNLTFELNDLTGHSLSLTNRTFGAPGRQAVPIDWGSYPAGMYFLTVSSKEGYRHTFRISNQ